MKEVTTYIFIFLFIFIIYLIYCLIKLKRKSYHNMSEYKILVNRYKVDINKHSAKKLMFIIAFANSFIIANAVMITTLVRTSNYIWMMLLVIFVLSILIVTVYTIIGKIIGKKK